MVGIGYAYVRRRAGGDVCYDVVIYFPVIRVKADIDLDVRVKRFKVGNGFSVYFHLRFVRIVLCPERYFVIFRRIKLLRQGEIGGKPRAVTRRENRHDRAKENSGKHRRENSFHPFVPPLATPSIILFLNTRKRIISGSDTATTAAIIAGMFSLPKPFSLIS